MNKTGLAVLALPLLGSELTAFPSDPVTTTQVARKTAPDGQERDRFGLRVALRGDGEVAVVGAYTDTHSAKTEAGSAYVFRRDGESWPFEAKLKAPDPKNLGYFGSSVDIDGDTIAVGARFDPDGGSRSGSAYLFTFDGSTWNFEAKLFDPTAISTDAFGWSISLSGDTLAVGAPWTDDLGLSSGSVYVYVRSNGTWSLEQEVHASDGTQGDHFGTAVLVDGDQLLVGAPEDSNHANLGGGAYVFERSNGVWSQKAKLVPTDLEEDDEFGTSVARSGTTIVVGSSFDSVGGLPTGSAYVFTGDGSSWSEEARLTASDAGVADYFGGAVAIEEDAIAVAGSSSDTLAKDAGAVYVFTRSGTTWGQSAQVFANDGVERDRFGLGLGFTGERLLVGAPGVADFTGAIYVYDVEYGARTYCTAKTNSCGTLPFIGSSGAPSASASSGFIVSAENTKALKQGVLLYGDSGPAALPFDGGFLCVNPMPLKRTVPVGDTTGTPAACDGSLSIDMNAFAAGALGGNPLPSLSIPGTQVHCQFAARDTVAGGLLLSDALEYVICP